ncbi:164_t:CDS:10 [Funneliformis geosporum]|uniref:Transcriptional adapter 2 n=1 Tax=Funneliformis geosporum TaxID=1117311 RepID=A0A9W4WUH9_9GLOM|nr:164_t:CDS:10 [Funneliformis geosporum]CAI2173102.1 2431_t:CDS:10 [Funneliformis geosporum]
MFRCKTCHANIGNTVRINCAECQDFDLCVTCFTSGAESDNHKSSHDYRVLEQYSFPLFTEDWGADEEELLIEGAEMHGLGNWQDIAEFIGSKTKEECEQHYMDIYENSETWPIPNMDVKFKLDDETMRERKRRRVVTIENRPQNPPPKVLTKPLQSLPANHEITGFMPNRMEFEHEYDNEAEHVIKDLEINEQDDPKDTEMKTIVLEIYNKKLKKRAERKKLIFEHGLLDYRKNKAMEEEKYKSKEEKELINKIKPFAQVLSKQDFDDLRDELLEELNTRIKIEKLQEYRRMGILTENEATKYEVDKAQKEANQLAARPHNGQFMSTVSASSDRLAKIYAAKISSVSQQQQSPLSSPYGCKTIPSSSTRINNRKIPAALDLNDAEGVHLLSEAERKLCENLRILPKSYLVIKETILKEWARSGGTLRRRQARDLIRIDVNKTARIYDFFIEMGWIRRISDNGYTTGEIGGGNGNNDVTSIGVNGGKSGVVINGTSSPIVNNIHKKHD